MGETKAKPKPARSREWKQYTVSDTEIADRCNRLDEGGWSIHSVHVLPIGIAGYPDNVSAVVILAYRAIFTPGVPPAPSGLR